MKVLQISPYFPPHVGGIEYHVKGLSEGLIERGYEVEVAASCGSSHAKFARIPCIDFLYFPVPLRFPRREADVYHSHVPSPTFAFWFKDAAPHVVTYHNDVVVPCRVNGHCLPRYLGGSLEWINRRLVGPVLDRAEIIIATTKSYAETSPVLRDYLHKIEIVPNAVDTTLFQPGLSRDHYVLYVGRLVDYKGIEMLLLAMRQVQDKVNLRLMMVGDGYDRSHFEKIANRMRLKIEFTGRVDRNKLIYLLSRAEMLVLPSANRLEAFGIVLLEAMACQTPVLAYDTPGVNEVARDGGMIFSETTELAEQILELHSDESRRTALGERGRRAVMDKYSWKKVLDKVESIYDEVTQCPI
jgi:glycosyltransferase involved in cell wall biosynthesis